MKRFKHNVIVTTALFLSFLTIFSTPVSAAEWNNTPINLANYLVYDNTSDAGITTTEYSYTGNRDGNNTRYILVSHSSQDYFSTGFSSEIYTTKEYKCYCYYSPGSFGTCRSDKDWTVSDVFYLPYIVDLDNLISCKFKMSFLLYSSVDVSLYFRVSITGKNTSAISENGFYDAGSVDTVKYENSNFSLSSDTYTPLDVEIDMTELVQNTNVDCFVVLVYFYTTTKLPSGTTISWSNVAPSDSADTLNPGFRIITTHSKSIDAPIFTLNLDSYKAYTTDTTDFSLFSPASVSDGGSVSYQWYRGTSSTNGDPITGATSALLTVDIDDPCEYYYYCVATNSNYGLTKSSKSNVCLVEIVEPPVPPLIVNDLVDGCVIEYVQNVKSSPLIFTVLTTDGGTITYQWYGSYDDGSLEKIYGATSSNYYPSTIDIGFTEYWCEATNTKAGFTSTITSGVVGIRVVPPPDPALPPVISEDLPTEPLHYEEDKAAAPLRIGATAPDGGELSYQWYQLVDNVSQALPGEIYASFTPDTVNPGTFYYYCVVTNKLNDTVATSTSSTATIVIDADQTDNLLQTIIDGITNLPQMILDGIAGLFIPDTESMAAYQEKWMELLSSRFGVIYDAVVLLDQFGQAIQEQAAQGTIEFPEVTIDLAGTPFVFGGWTVQVVPDGFDMIISGLKMMIDIVATFAFVNGMRKRFEGIMGGA